MALVFGGIPGPYVRSVQRKDKIRVTNLEAVDFILNIIRQLSKPVPVPTVQIAQLALKHLLIQNLTNTHTPSRSLVAVTGANTLTRSTDFAAAELGFFQSVDDGVQIEADVGTIRDEDALVNVDKTLVGKGAQFFEEAGDVDDGAGADEIDAFRRDEAGGEDVEVVGHGVMNDGVAGIYERVH